MTKSKTSEKWLEAGYECFAREGPDGIQVERLARIVALNKSGFYHYFGDHEAYIAQLIDYHRDHIRQFVVDARSLKTFDPEYLELIVAYKLTSMVQMQLGRHQQDPLFAKVFADGNLILSSAVTQLWADFLNIPDNPTLASRYYQLVRSSLYANGRSAELSYEVLSKVAHDAKVIAEEMIKREKQSLPNRFG